MEACEWAVALFPLLPLLIYILSHHEVRSMSGSRDCVKYHEYWKQQINSVFISKFILIAAPSVAMLACQLLDLIWLSVSFRSAGRWIS